MSDDQKQEVQLNEIKILLIDDIEDVLQENERWLRKYGYEHIECAQSAAQASKMFGDKKHFDIIVVDMRMEEVTSGFKIIIEGEEKLSSSVIVFTANDNVLDCRQSFKRGAWDYIPKTDTEINPFEELHKSIVEAIEFNREWGNIRDETWISNNIDELTKEFSGEYVAIMDQQAIANEKDRDSLMATMKAQGLPTFMPVILKIPEGEYYV